MTVTIDLIRQKILNKAIRGELVEQNPKDEPVELLLKRIEVKKTQLIKEKKINKQKPLNPIEGEIPYDLPEGWKWVRLGTYTYIIMGQSPPSASYNDSEEGMPFYQGKSEFGKMYPTPIKWCTKPKKTASMNDILISVRAPVGHVNICPEESCIGRGLASIKTIIGDFKYLFYVLKAKEKEIEGKGTGTTFKSINSTALNELLIPVPPLNEQTRIVKKIESLLSLCSKWENEVEKQLKYLSALREKVLDDAMKGLLVEQNEKDEPAVVLLEKIEKEKQKLIKEKKVKKQKPLPSIEGNEIPYELPKGWKWVRLGSYAHINMGQSPPSTSYNDSGDGMPFYQGKSGFGKMFPTPTKWCTEPKKIASKNDILISVRAPVGQVNICQEESCIGRGLASIKTIVGDYMYLFYVLKAKEKEIEEKGTGTTFKSINAQTLNDLLIPIPPLNEQKRIVEKIENAFTYIDKLESQLIIPK